MAHLETTPSPRRSFAFALALAFAFASRRAFANPPSCPPTRPSTAAELKAISAEIVAGDARVRAPGAAAWALASAGGRAGRGAAIVAGEGGVTMVFPSGNTLVLDGGGRVELQSLAPSWRDSAPVMAAGGDRVRLVEGVATLRSGPGCAGRAARGPAAAVVQGPRGVAVVARAGGTRIKVEGDAVWASSSSDLVTSEGGGGVLMTKGCQVMRLAPGWVGQARGPSPLEVRRLPEAPTRRRCRTLAFRGTAFGEPISLAWEAHGDATSYEVVLESGRGAPRVIDRQVLPATAREVRFALAPVGAYGARVRALDAQGFAGPWAERVQLDVVGASLGAGARLMWEEGGSEARVGAGSGVGNGGVASGAVVLPASGAVVLPASGALELQGAEGLVLGGALAREAGESTRVVLGAPLPALLTLRREGEREPLTLRLLPEITRAEVAFAVAIDPARGEGVIVTVRGHAGGRVVPDGNTLRPIVWSGGRVVKPVWAAIEGGVRARLPAGETREGLWVRVLDERGGQVGEGRWGWAAGGG